MKDSNAFIDVPIKNKEEKYENIIEMSQNNLLEASIKKEFEFATKNGIL